MNNDYMNGNAKTYSNVIALCEGAITIFIDYVIGEAGGFHPYVNVSRHINEQEIRLCFEALSNEQSLYINLNRLDFDFNTDMQLNFVGDKPISDLTLTELVQFKKANLYIENYELVAKAQEAIDLISGITKNSKGA